MAQAGAPLTLLSSFLARKQSSMQPLFAEMSSAVTWARRAAGLSMAGGA